MSHKWFPPKENTAVFLMNKDTWDCRLTEIFRRVLFGLLNDIQAATFMSANKTLFRNKTGLVYIAVTYMAE